MLFWREILVFTFFMISRHIFCQCQALPTCCSSKWCFSACACCSIRSIKISFSFSSLDKLTLMLQLWKYIKQEKYHQQTEDLFYKIQNYWQYHGWCPVLQLPLWNKIPTVTNYVMFRSPSYKTGHQRRHCGHIVPFHCSHYLIS